MTGKMLKKYLASINISDKHNINSSIAKLDFEIRELIGKSLTEEPGKCSHQQILQREMEKDGKDLEHYCRKCGLNLNQDGILRCNDFLIFRNEKCRGPICGECIENGGDIFYNNYIKALELHKDIKSLENCVND